MATRSVPWQRTISDAVSWHQDQAQSATIYILREMGPTGFLLKEDGETKKFKVFLGDPHKCTCSVFMKEKDLCKHICWVLLKKFRLDRHNELTFQRGLVEREINEVLRGLAKREDPRRKAAANRIARAAQGGGAYQHPDGRQPMEQREITEEDVCPICQDELLGSREPVTYCRFGCAKSIHTKCMKVWADHQKSTGETILKCALCREDFGQIEVVDAEYRNTMLQKTRAERADIHMGLSCMACSQSPITGKCYKCSSCADYYLCQNCFAGNSHVQHSFQFRQKSNQRWRPAQRGSGGALPAAVMSDLQNRDITDEDYDMLLQLDNAASNQPSSVPDQVVRSFPVETVREGSGLLSLGTQCRVCLRSYTAGQLVKRLPCKHKFHAECIDQWLLHEHPTCPVDGTVVWSPFMGDSLGGGRPPKKKNANKPLPQGSHQDRETMQSTPALEIVPGIGTVRLQGRKQGQGGVRRGGGRGGYGRGHLTDKGPEDGGGASLAADFQLTGAAFSTRPQPRSSPAQHRENRVSHQSPSRTNEHRSRMLSGDRNGVHQAALHRLPSHEDLINHIAAANTADIPSQHNRSSRTPDRVHNLHFDNELTNERSPGGSGRSMVGHRPPIPPTATERGRTHISSIPLPREEAMTPIGPNHHGSSSAPSHTGRRVPSEEWAGPSPGSVRDRGRLKGKASDGGGGGRRRVRSSSTGRNRSSSRDRLLPQPQDRLDALENLFLGSMSGQLLASASGNPSKPSQHSLSSHHPRPKCKLAVGVTCKRGSHGGEEGGAVGMVGDLALAGNALNSLHLSGLDTD